MMKIKKQDIKALFYMVGTAAAFAYYVIYLYFIVGKI